MTYVCEVCGVNPVSRIWDTCLCAKRICFSCVKRRVVAGAVEIRCGDTCERPEALR